MAGATCRRKAHVYCDRPREGIDARALEENEAGEGEGLRIYLTGEGEFEMSVDEVQEQDRVVAESGRPLVIVDEAMSWELDGATLDAEEGPEGYDLMLDLPDHEDGQGEDVLKPSANGAG